MSELPIKYPIYIPSKGRADIGRCTTDLFIKDGVPFKLVIEEQEYDDYAKRWGDHRLLVLPFSNRGSVIPARNWIKDHATEHGHERHWQFDDNIFNFYRWYKGVRMYVNARVAISLAERFVDRYENIAVAGFNYSMFAVPALPPFMLNTRVYSASLILNSLSNRWRGRYNEDSDFCLQVLADGWCTVLFNAFLVDKLWTMQMGGGNTRELYGGDGRLRMAKELERLWPGVVHISRKFQRPQHVIKDNWQRFDTSLRLKEGVDLADLPPVNEYGMKIKKVASEVKSQELRSLMDDFNE